MAQSTSASFGSGSHSGNHGFQVGQSYGTINAAFHLPPEPSEPPPVPFAAIPFRRDPDFVNRGDILDQIDRVCSEPAGRVALVGLGGIGKSQLAIEFAHRIVERSADTWVFWIYASTRARVEEGFAIIADMIKLPNRNQPKANTPQLVYTWLSNERNGKWIIIVDSADDLDVLFDKTRNTDDGRPLATYLPQSRNGSIILTTRDKDLAFRLTGDHRNIVEVGPMTETDGLHLLENRLSPLSDVTTALDLIRELDLVPLAISQAAAYIHARAPLSSIEKYLAEFRGSEAKRLQLLEHDAGDLRREGGASNAILTTWQVSFDHIRSKSPSAADLLSLMSFFNAQGIPEDLLRISRNTQGSTRSTSPESSLSQPDLPTSRDGHSFNRFVKKASRKFKKSIPLLPHRAFHFFSRGTSCKLNHVGHPKIDDERMGFESHSGAAGTMDSESNRSDSITDDGFEDDVAMLRAFCLITTNEGGHAFEMHGLVQLSTKRWLKAYGQQETFKGQYIELMADSFPSGEYETWGTCQRLFPHLEAAFEYRPTNQTQESDLAYLLFRGGLYAREQGMYDVAERMVRQAVQIDENTLGKDNEATLGSTALLASIFRGKGMYREAEKLQVQVLETRKMTLGVDHPDTLRSMNNLANIWQESGRYEDAIALMRECAQDVESNKQPQGEEIIYPADALLTPRQILFDETFCTSMIFNQAGLGNTLTTVGVIGQSFGITNPGQLSWLIAGYSLTIGTFILIGGRLVGLSVYSPYVLFIFARVFQGIGPALTLPNGLAILGQSYSPGPRKNMSFAWFGGSAPFGAIAGFVFGGLFALAWWPWIYWSQAITLAGMAAFAAWTIPPLPVQPTQDRTLREKLIDLDIPGGLAGVTTLVLFNFA
ncbi:hypothetical protein QQX98_000920 [Neonectria punicea]|uniref:NB-ARC domain-containing protein n=1 Tax=Neonectria punicea TaxID=979145 RepID=A0ABR1HR73_9HYPO